MLRTIRAAGTVLVVAAILAARTSSPSATATPAATIPFSAVPSVPTTPPTAAPTGVPTAEPTAEPTVEPTAKPTVEPTAAPTAEPTPDETEPPFGAEDCVDGAWIGFFGYGITCLDAAGWHAYTEETANLRSDQVEDLVSCPDGRTWIATTLGLHVTDGSRWDDLSDDLDGRHPSSVACDPDGGVWAGGFGFVGHVTDAGVTWYETSELGTGEFVEQVKDVAVAPDGTAWVITPNSVARFDGRAWRTWEGGAHFSDTDYFEAIAVSADGTPWVGFGSGVYTFDGTAWDSLVSRSLSLVQSVLVDLKGRVWAGTYSDGVSVWNGSKWSVFTRESGALPSDHVRTMAVDAGGHVWIGTEYGLAVYDGKTWRAYHMHTSGLADNEVYAVSVVGKGPKLPALEEKATGALTGVVVRDGKPLAGATVEVCVEFIGFSYSGDTPCSGQPFSKSTSTAKDGTFTIKALPTGRYSITLETPEGKWLRVTDQFSIGVRKATVLPGGTTDLGELDLTED